MELQAIELRTCQLKHKIIGKSGRVSGYRSDGLASHRQNM